MSPATASVFAMSKPIIREATLVDIEPIQAMFAEFVKTSQYRKYIGVNPEYSMGQIERLIANEDGAVFVADDAGTLIGMCGVVSFPHPWSGEQVAAEAFWWLQPDRRGFGQYLLKRAEKWARAKGARSLSMMAPCDKPRVAQIYEVLGYEAVETIYQKDLR